MQKADFLMTQHILNKPVFEVCKRLRLRRACLATEIICRREILHINASKITLLSKFEFKPLVILCGCTAGFVSDLVRNPEDRFPLYSAHMSRVVRKPAFCKCENKDADQLRGNREADQRLCFCYIDSTIPLLPKSEISSL